MREYEMRTSGNLFIILFLCFGCQCQGIEDVVSSTSKKATGDSGIEGRVVRGPMCPNAESAAPCPDEPFSASFEVFDGQGNEITRFDSDTQGNFHVALDPGVYMIVPGIDAPLMLPKTQEKQVDVQENQFLQVTLRFDTGIR